MARFDDPGLCAAGMPQRPAMPATQPERAAGAPAVASRYARYALAVLVVVYVFNFLDRQILSILAEHIRRDLGVNDAQLGFLYGTAFAVFYAVFGIPLGRLADTWDRRKLIALGLAAWSVMTALSGFARTFPELAAARVGVGVGEASASPAAYSLLSDWFPAARRATALAIYSSGIYLGAGLGLGVGGVVVAGWDAAYADAAAPFALRGWQVAFLVVGLVAWLGSPAQWISLGVGVYAAGSSPWTRMKNGGSQKPTAYPTNASNAKPKAASCSVGVCARSSNVARSRRASDWSHEPAA